MLVKHKLRKYIVKGGNVSKKREEATQDNSRAKHSRIKQRRAKQLSRFEQSRVEQSRADQNGQQVARAAKHS